MNFFRSGRFGINLSYLIAWEELGEDPPGSEGPIVRARVAPGDIMTLKGRTAAAFLRKCDEVCPPDPADRPAHSPVTGEVVSGDPKPVRVRKTK